MNDPKNSTGPNVSRETFLEPQPRPGVMAIDAYVPGKSAAPAGVKIHKLSANETPLGPSPAAQQAYAAFAPHLELYPDGSAHAIRHAIGAHFGLDPTRIVCGAGSDELLALLANIYIAPGDEGILTEHGFLVYKIAIQAAGGTPIIAPETNLTTDIDAILNSVTARTKIVFIANPNNPTGTYLPFPDVKRLATSLPPDVLLVLDGAYAEYVTKNDYSAGIELVSDSKNVVMTRTFSKIYGLAALRIGWCYAPALVCEALNRVRGPFNTNSAASAAAIAALGDQAHIDRAIAHNTHWADWLTEQLQKLGLKITPSAGNFLLVHFKDADQAKAADEFLTSRGLILRAVKAYGLPHCLRLTVGLEEANRLVAETLKEFLGLGSKPVA